LNKTRDALYYELEGGKSVYSFKEDQLTASHGEIYLKLYALDLEDPDAITDFVGLYSVLQGDEMYQRLKQGGFFLDQRSRPYVAERRRVYESARTERALRDDLPLGTQIETLLEFQIAADRLRSLTSEWIRLSTGADPIPTGRGSWHSFMYWKELLGNSLDNLLPLLLRSYSPSVETLRLAASRYWPTSTWAQPAPLFEICALELFNHIASSTTYRTCENEPCRRPFVHQEREVEHGVSRTQGLKYCSRRCAQAAASREYRARRAMRERGSRDRPRPSAWE
jgi:hypothetical protein